MSKGSGVCNFCEHVNAWETRKLVIISNYRRQFKPGKKTDEQAKLTKKHQKKLPKKRKSTGKQNTAAKKSKVQEEPTERVKPTGSPKYNPGDFVAVGLKPKRGPLCVYMAEGRNNGCI